MTFVGAPIQTSTPVGALGTPGPVTAFSYGTSDAHTQPGGPQGQVVPASVPVLTASNMAILTSAPTPTPPVTTSYTPSSMPHPSARTHHSPSRPSPTPHSPPRNPRSPPRTSSSPASVTDTRGPRGPEQSRKSILELERKLAHRKSGKFSDSSRGQHKAGIPSAAHGDLPGCWPQSLITLSTPVVPRIKAAGLGEAGGGDRLPAGPQDPVQHLPRACEALWLHSLQHSREDHPGVSCPSPLATGGPAHHCKGRELAGS